MRNAALLIGALMVLFSRGDVDPRADPRPSAGSPAPAGTPRAPGPAGTRLVSDAGGAFAQLVIHFDPAAEDPVAPTYRDLLRAVDPSVTVWVVVARAADFTRFVKRARAWGVPRDLRFRSAVVGRSVTTWSRDRYTLLQGARPGSRVLLVRPRPDDANPARRNDWYAPFALARAVGSRVQVQVSPLVFDGGDLVGTRRHVFATGLLLGRNVQSDLRTVAATTRYLRRVTGLEPVIIGRRPEDVPPHHVGMFLTPLDDARRTVLVGDPRLGLALLTPQAEARLPRPVLRAPAFLERFERVAREVRRAGFRVIRTPLVPLDDRLTYVTYNNVIMERRVDGKLHAYVPQFGLSALDAAGRRAFTDQGVVVHPIDVSRIYRHNGTVRCLVNVLDRLPERAASSPSR